MTAEAIGEVLAFGVGVALSPLAVVAVIALVVAPRGPGAAWVFVAAWIGSLALVATLAVLLADGADASADAAPATWVSVAKSVVAVALLLFAGRQWRGRDEGGGEGPAWIRGVEEMSSARAAGLAVLLAVVKPKNLLLTVGAALAVAQVGASAAGQAAAVAVFVVLASVGLAVPLAIHVGMGRRGGDVLVGMRDWMARENTTIIVVLSLVIAAKLLGDALVALAGGA